MDIEVDQFANRYQNEEYIIKILSIEDVGYAREEGHYYFPAINFCAYIDERTNKLYQVAVFSMFRTYQLIKKIEANFYYSSANKLSIFTPLYNFF